MIIRIALIALVAWGFVWLADRPGTVTVNWLGQVIELPVLASLLALVVAFIVLTILWSVVRRIFAAPGSMSGFFANRRKKKAYDALTKGIVAVGAGDAGQATKFATKAAKLTGNDALSKLLTAQAAQLRGDRSTVTRVFEDMTTTPDTELLGLRGLFTQARQDGDMEAARGLAERAVAKNPDLPWASRAMLALQSAEQDWAGAARTLENQRRAGTITKAEEDRRRAVVLTAQAVDLEDENPDEALSLAERAHKLAPELVPAAVVAGRILISRANIRKAGKILEQTWKLSPHPDVAEIYAYLRSGDSPQDRQRRISQLIGKSSGDLEGAIAMARTSIDAQDWRDARRALSMYVDDRPPVRICELMAEIEQGEYGDKGRAREWLGRAVHAPRDPVWVTDGFASHTWLPVSPVTGELDAFEWKVPVEGLSAPLDEAVVEDDIVAADIAEMVAEDVSPSENSESADNKVDIVSEVEDVDEAEIVEIVDVPEQPESKEGGVSDENRDVEDSSEKKADNADEKPAETKGNGKADDSLDLTKDEASQSAAEGKNKSESEATDKSVEKSDASVEKVKPARKSKAGEKPNDTPAQPLRQPDDPGPNGDAVILGSEKPG